MSTMLLDTISVHFVSVWLTSFFIYLAFLKVKRSEKMLFWGRKMPPWHVWETAERVWRVFFSSPFPFFKPESRWGLRQVWIRGENVALQLSLSLPSPSQAHRVPRPREEVLKSAWIRRTLYHSKPEYYYLQKVFSVKCMMMMDGWMNKTDVRMRQLRNPLFFLYGCCLISQSTSVTVTWTRKDRKNDCSKGF